MRQESQTSSRREGGAAPTVQEHRAGPRVTPTGDREAAAQDSGGATGKPSVWTAGVLGGAVGMLCCVGPTVLALIGVVSAGTAFVWATNLYDGYAWWFRLGGLLVLAGLLWWSLRRHRACNRDGMLRWRRRLLAAGALAVVTYGVLYGVTTWLGTFA